jgi:hypothetical protein
MKRICNVNSFSAILDRLIIENLKIIHFSDKGLIDSVTKQNEIITSLKHELNIIFEEIYSGSYDSIKEQRTFNSNALFENLFRLCLNNYCIAKGDSLKIEESKKSIINVQNLIGYINFVRDNLEERAKSKNTLENIL